MQIMYMTGIFFLFCKRLVLNNCSIFLLYLLLENTKLSIFTDKVSRKTKNGKAPESLAEFDGFSDTYRQIFTS